MGTRFNIARAGAAVAVAAVAASVAALPAAADTAKGRLTEGGDSGFTTQLTNGEKVLPRLLNLQLQDGSQLRVYCIEITVDASDEVDMVESGWDAYPKPDAPFTANRDKINWILHHGFPGKSVQELNGLQLQFNDGLTQNEAITATQAAIWHYSDGVDINRESPVVPAPNDPDYDGESTDADVLALYDYLTGKANTGIDEQVIGALKIDPAEQSGTIGAKVGPFKVTTNGTVTGVKAELPDGVSLVTADGKAADKAGITNETELFLDVPAGTAPGAGTFEITADSPAVETGRLFVGEGYESNPVQSLIVASSETKPLTASAKAAWDVAPVTPPTTTTPAPQASPSPELADTGASILVPALLGLGLVGAGAGAIIYQRKRKSA
ncbi:thioester domain-containing protein [Actinokineospora bangkokensis]|uniref:Gram-positive cocci surface proteins LPxTG domain-containing protein n=1 Tax=Actinokineospora bangkokensis TaxID=1193682 RepID=A0A1Q9LHL6_9PSEU|nr:thioester domain-containing protein [Actinokineospora bangkokensis]OLR91439.1 hypothetical protein BJP25_00970 [Actinokineospora bangkokensis]